MTDYSKMSDFEINKRIAHALGNAQVCHADDEINGATVQYFVYKSSGLNREGLISMRPHIIKKDFCNNPADAWPIIVENRISLMFDKSTEEGDDAQWCLASSPCDQYIVDYVSESKLLRAAMIVFLMMQDARNEK